jgi:uroporphyrinogen-III synthase
VLITRPEPGASATATGVVALGLRPVMAPLLAIRWLQVAIPPSARLQAILVTSGNALAMLPDSHRHLPLYAVGRATAERAQSQGFERVTSADGDADALCDLVTRSCPPGGPPLLLASGRHQGNPLATELRKRGFSVVRRVVYAAEPVQSLPDAALDELRIGSLRAALFFSAETARTWVRLVQSLPLREAVSELDAVAISQPAAVALEALPWRRVRVAVRPNQDAMLALLR